MLAFVGALAAVACEPEPEKPATIPPPDRAVLTPAQFGDLPGWSGDRHAEALPALMRSCGRFQKIPVDRSLGNSVPGGTIADILPACSAALALPAGDDAAAREFFET